MMDKTTCEFLSASALSVLICALAGCSTTTTSSTAAATGGIYDGYTQSYSVPWIGSPNFSNLTSTLKVQASVNGGAVASYTVDTGSVGVVVPATDIPNFSSAGLTAGSLTYSSSGLQLTGYWDTLPMTFPGATNASGASAGPSATVPVLAVTKGSCTGSGVNSGSCTGAIPHMLGVGFGRGTSAQDSPLYNPFLNLTEMNAGTMRRGYIIGRSGLTLGLTSKNVSSNFVMQPLTSAGTPAVGTHNDWVTPSGGFKIASGSELTGTVLLDTGLLDMIVEDTSLPSSGQIGSGTGMTIYIGSHNYVFAVNDGGGATPTSTNYATASHGTFVNTGLRALYHYDLLFDADGGLYGLWFVQ